MHLGLHVMFIVAEVDLISSLQCISWIPYRDFIVVPLTLNTLIDQIYVSSIVSVSMLPLQGGRIRMQERVHIVRLFR